MIQSKDKWVLTYFDIDIRSWALSFEVSWMPRRIMISLQILCFSGGVTILKKRSRRTSKTTTGISSTGNTTIKGGQ